MQLTQTRTTRRPLSATLISATLFAGRIALAILIWFWLLTSNRDPRENLQPVPVVPTAMPMVFVPNLGQLDGPEAFEAFGGRGHLTFDKTGLQLALPDGELSVVWSRSRPDTTVSGNQTLSSTANIYRGSDPRYWRSGLPTYRSLRYRELYPGIDLVYDGSEGLLKGTYFVAPGADPATIGWRYTGATAVTLQPDGDLQIALNATAVLVEKAPIAYQLVNDTRQPVPVTYRLAADGIGFTLGSYDPALPLVIDPTLVYSSYFGGSSDDDATAVAVDSGGSVYVAGRTYSASLPGGGGGGAGYDDLFVTKLNAAGTAVVYTTILGGSGSDEPRGAAVNGSGSKLWITGATTSDNLPTRNAFQPSTGGGSDAFVMQLDGSGALAFSSYYGGDLYDAGEDIALDSGGNAHLTGALWGGFFAKVSGQTFDLEYARMIAGQEATGYGIALDNQNNIYVTGKIRSDSWPTVHPVQADCGAFDGWTCSDDAFVVKITPAGDELLFSTYLGGSAAGGGSGTDIAHAIAVDAGGNIAVVGETFAADFPVVNAVQAHKPGGSTQSAAFVTRLVKQDAGYQVGFSTFLGGNATDWATDVWMDPTGQIYVVGGTNSDNFPVAAAWQPQRGPGVCFSSTSRNCYDAFIALFTAGGALPFSTYLGGTDDDVATAVAAGNGSSLMVVGQTESQAFPVTAGGFQPGRAQGQEAFVVKVNAGAPPPPPDRAHRTFLPLAIR